MYVHYIPTCPLYYTSFFTPLSRQYKPLIRLLSAPHIKYTYITALCENFTEVWLTLLFDYGRNNRKICTRFVSINFFYLFAFFVVKNNIFVST